MVNAAINVLWNLLGISLMSLDVLTFGLNHVSAPVSVRERVSFNDELIKPALDGLRSTFGSLLGEAAILSTCNRTEIYCAAHPQVSEHIPNWLADFNQLGNSVNLQPHLYSYQQNQAVRHAFRVASGLDSMVLGEPQILGQMKDAMRAASQAGALGTLLHQLFQRTFAVAKEVRSQTAIGANSVSMAAAAVKLAQRVFGHLGESRVLFIGAGEMIELCATHFAAAHPKEITVANRTKERAELLANRFGATTFKLAELPEKISEYDVIVSCTASSLPILGLGMVEKATRLRRHKPMVMVDLAVPRDIETEVGRLADIYLYTVDDLASLVQTASESRQAAVVQAEAIIEARVLNFMQWLASRENVPAIKQYKESAEEIQQIELDRARRALARGVDPESVIQQLAHSLTQKHLHGPLSALNNANGSNGEEIISIVSSIMPNIKRRH